MTCHYLPDLDSDETACGIIIKPNSGDSFSKGMNYINCPKCREYAERIKRLRELGYTE